MPRWPKPPEGSWTEHFGLGTEPMSYEDSISHEFFELEREAVFKRAWLTSAGSSSAADGSYFTKELAVAETSVVVVRGRTARSAPSTTCAGTGEQAGLE